MFLVLSVTAFSIGVAGIDHQKTDSQQMQGYEHRHDSEGPRTKMVNGVSSHYNGTVRI